MNIQKATTLLIAISVAHSVTNAAEIVHHESNQYFNKQTLLHLPSNRPKALLVLIPSGGLESYSESKGYTPSKVPRILATRHDIATLIVASAGPMLFGDDRAIEELDRIIAKTLIAQTIRNHRIAVGGFSAGGLGAARYALHSLKTHDTTHPIAALFAVDAPLDYERWHRASTLYLNRLAQVGRYLNEERQAIRIMENELGGTPKTELQRYRQASPVTGRLAEGGNALHFTRCPIRLYIEPAVKWRLDHWNRDVDNTNLPDATTLISLLQLHGNPDATLITTTKKGYRRNGSRNPHSWSIVDEENLILWLRQHLLPTE